MLETKRLILEPWHERHRLDFQRMCRLPEVMRFIGPGEPWEEQQANEMFERARSHWAEHGFGWHAAIERKSGTWVGLINLNYLGPGLEGLGADEVEIGWWVTPALWGRGYASEGAACLRDEGFGRLGLERIIARLQPANLASARVAEKIGMNLEREARGRTGERLQIYALGRPGPNAGEPSKQASGIRDPELPADARRL
ncbi:MAG TPA: GNAT family N-acetyltransferase [Gaiellaceae bacterium]